MKPKHARPTRKTDETPLFIELWETVWPAVRSQYDGRAFAREAYFRHVWWNDADEQDIVDAARFYVRTATTSNDNRRLLFSNWMDRGAYEDLAVQERDFQRRLTEIRERRGEAPANVVSMNPASDQIDPELRARIVEEGRRRMRGQS